MPKTPSSRRIKTHMVYSLCELAEVSIGVGF